MNIRPAQPQDLTALIELCELHAIYEKADYGPQRKSRSAEKALIPR